MIVRKVLFWLHLAAALVVGANVLVMSVTGVLLAFERQMVEAAESDLRSTPQPGAMRLSPENILARVREQLPDAAPTGLTLRADPGAPATISIGRDTALFVNPNTGAILGEGAKQLRAFFHGVLEWHRWLARDGGSRDTGRAITGACNLAFLFLIVSGVYLWFPRRWTRSAFAAVSLPSLRLRGKARDFNWHNAIGLWSAPALFLIVLTGVLMSYPWATNLLYRATGTEPPARSGPAGDRRERPGAVIVPNGLDKLWERAGQQAAGWQIISVRFASSPNAPVPFMIEGGQRGRADLRAMLTLDPKTGEVVKWEPFASYNLGRQFRTWARWIHTGEAAGLPGQIIAALASAGAAVLVWTGFALSWRRFSGRKAAAEATRTTTPLEPVETR